MTDTQPVLPGLAVPEPLELWKKRAADEEVPYQTRLWRVGLNDMPKLGWLIERLMRAAPHVPAHQWQSHLVSYMTSGEFFQRSERAVGLARYRQGDFSAPHVDVIFLLHQDLGSEGGSKRGSQGEKDCIALVRAMIEWGRHQGAQEVRRLNHLTDLSASVFANDLKAEKREEMVVQIR
jgi:hypothetical protein